MPPHQQLLLVGADEFRGVGRGRSLIPYQGNPLMRRYRVSETFRARVYRSRSHLPRYTLYQGPLTGMGSIFQGLWGYLHSLV
jgi:hypothetical protein